MNDDEVLVFVHIAKTAGSSLIHMLERNFFRRHTCGVYEGNIAASLQSGTGVYEADDASRLFKKDASKTPVCKIRAHRFSVPIRRHIGFVSGHMRYGIHEHIDQPVSYMTFVREPVSR